jgi:hypothetical protein
MGTVPLYDKYKDARKPFSSKQLQHATTQVKETMAGSGFFVVTRKALGDTIAGQSAIPKKLRMLTLQYVYFDAFNISEYGR